MTESVGGVLKVKAGGQKSRKGLTGQVTFEERPEGCEGALPHGYRAGKEREFQQMQKLGGGSRPRLFQETVRMDEVEKVNGGK